MKIKTIILVLAIGAAVPAAAEVWGCRQVTGFKHQHEIELTADFTGGTGTITLQGLP